MTTSGQVTDRAWVGTLAEEQAALRRVATLVAGGASSKEVFDAVAEEVAQVLCLANVAVCRYDDDGAAMTVLAVYGERPRTFQPGSRWPLDGPSMSREILRTGRPTRFEDYTDLPGALAAEAREHGFNRVAGAPITVDGRVWGVISTSSPDAPLPEDLEDRLAQFTELVATAIANSQAHDELARLAEEQAALRRVATLVAQGTTPAEVSEAVIAEVGRLIPADAAALTRYETDETVTIIGGWSRTNGYVAVGTRHPLGRGTLGRLVFETCRPGRIDSYEGASGSLAGVVRDEMGWRSAVGAPIVVEGRLWGVLGIGSTSGRPLPPDAEERLAEFTELVATAIANAESREELTGLAEEQAALKRVATLVAQGPPPAEVFAAVSAEVARLVPADGAALTRFEDDGNVTALGGWTSSGGYRHVGTRYSLEGTVSGRVFETGRPARVRSYADAPGAAAAAGREMGWRSSVGAPITVEGRLWGVLAAVSTSDQELPLDTEGRLAQFTDLVATAIANAESRKELTRLAEEQAALRRVATRVARGAPPAEVFEAVSAEVGRLIPADVAGLKRYEPDGTVTALGGWTRTGGYHIDIGERYELGGHTGTRLVFETRRPARIDGYETLSGRSADAAREAGWRSRVAAPIIVEGRLWGVIGVASTTDQPLPFDTEGRLTQFTELLATAIANAESRAELDTSRARIVATADATRRRIERDLHDGAQQRLVSLALELRAAQAAVPPELDKLHAELSSVVEGHASVLDELREIAQGIHPAILADGGLARALRTLARRSPIPVTLDVQAEGRLPEPVEVAAYYVVSEALTNVAKHACASAVHVAVAAREGVLRVAVQDDGLGGADPASGSGLLGLKDRAEASGGTLSLESLPGAGTSLLVELPVDEQNR